jgi:hypothetical protein
LGSEAKKACQPSPLDKKVGKVMALCGDGLSYLADWPLGMSPASAVAIVRGDGVGSNATAAARPALPGLAGDRGTITVVPVDQFRTKTTGIANDRHPSAAEGSQFDI